MKPTAYQVVKHSPEVQQWWQKVLDDPLFGVIVDAAAEAEALSGSSLASARPATAIEAAALEHAYALGGQAFRRRLLDLGAALAEREASDKLRQEEAEKLAPVRAWRHFKKED